jgi:predicted enzyme related to lactoylglutathione lyase
MAKKPMRGRRTTGARSTTRQTTPKHKFTRGLYGWITHTDLASLDPAATKEWCSQGGGGIRPTSPPETPGSLPYVHVPDAAAAFTKALKEGAEEMMPPTRVMEGVTVAIVRAPGGVPIGFSGP